MRVKQVPEDFIVEELHSRKPAGSGQFSWFILRKRGVGTLEAARTLARHWNVQLKDIGFAGLKDAQAITTQVCSVKRVPDVRVPFDDGFITTTFLGYDTEPVTLGSHAGNRFSITVRDIERGPVVPARFINYFGDQRFSVNNAGVGKAIVKGDYATALALVLDTEPQDAGTLRAHLAHAPTDTLGALRMLPKKLLRLFVHAYQSKLWNDAVRTLAKGILPFTVPVVGFGSEPSDHHVQLQLKHEGIQPRAFVLRSFPELSEEGTTRATTLDVQHLKHSTPDDDELNAGMKKITLTFTLPPGGYATEVVKQLFSQETA
jgi:tRNA(Glu) U13 pseudouridine synthase TruD